MLRGRWFRFGYACVNFGGLISARDWLANHAGSASGDLRGLDKERRFEVIARLAADVMAQVAGLVPVLSVSLVATVLLEAEGPIDEFELKLRTGKLMAEFAERSAGDMMLLRGTEGEAVADPRRCPKLDVWLGGQWQAELSCPLQEGVLGELPLLPKQIDAATVAVYIQGVVAGEKLGPAPLERQVELLMRSLRRLPMPSPEAA